jgi:hypothetical protein
MAESSAGKRQGLPRQQQIPSDGVFRVRRLLVNYCLILQRILDNADLPEKPG